MRPFHDLYFFSRAVKRYLVTLSLAFTVLVYLIPFSRHQALAFWFVSNSWFVSHFRRILLRGVPTGGFPLFAGASSASSLVIVLFSFG